MYYLYEIVNSINSKKYIGVSCNPVLRFKSHKSRHSLCRKLKNAIRKHGEYNFTMNILCIGREEYILDLEAKAIEAYNTVNSGYNILHGDQRLRLRLPQEVKDRISEGLLNYYSKNDSPLVEYYKNNNVHNKGDYMNTLEDNKPHYVSGFWFKTAGLASITLRVKSESIRKWRRNGTLGEFQRIRVDSSSLVPVYIRGIWFPDIGVASSKLCRHKATLLKYVRSGDVGQVVSYKDITGEGNPMFGRSGDKHPNSKRVSVEGVIFNSISCAVKSTKYTKSMLEKRLKKSVVGFYYV